MLVISPQHTFLCAGKGCIAHFPRASLKASPGTVNAVIKPQRLLGAINFIKGGRDF